MRILFGGSQMLDQCSLNGVQFFRLGLIRLGQKFALSDRYSERSVIDDQRVEAILVHVLLEVRKGDQQEEIQALRMGHPLPAADTFAKPFLQQVFCLLTDVDSLVLFDCVGVHKYAGDLALEQATERPKEVRARAYFLSTPFSEYSSTVRFLARSFDIGNW